jgi:flagellin
MASVINSNISSLNAQRNLTTSATALTTSLQRLSSGLRINSAKDDAAGMAISSRMTSQINGLNQAARNANDGISLAQTAEGSLNAITDNLQRMRELAVQSSNASNSASDRATLQNEVSQLSAEIQRVASGAQFNGVNLLDGTFSGATFQVGANNTANDQITVSSITDARTSALGVGYAATVTSSAVSGEVSNGSTATINTASVIATVADGVSSVNSSGSAKAWATAINGTAGTGGVTATASTAVAGAAMTAATLTGTITINGVATAPITTAVGSAANSRASVVAAINFISGATGVTATDTGADATGVTLAAADGRNVVTSFTTLTAAATGVKAASTNYGALTLTAKGTSGITAGGTVAALGSPTTTNATQQGTAIQNITVASALNALTALDSIDSALTSINNARASLGATQNRFASVVSNLMVTSENLTASRSRIQDADFAAETAAMTRGQILQQAGTAILAQANSLPNSVLSLLKG